MYKRQVLGLDKEVGSIEVGKKADLALIETKSVNMQPIYDYYACLLYTSIILSYRFKWS